MADTKISAMTPSGALSGTEELEVVQGGATRKTTTQAVADLAAGGVSSHAALSGLGADDHTQYHTDARGDARYAAKGVSLSAGLGLLGGGDLSANRVFDVNPGLGLRISGDYVALDTTNSRNIDHEGVSVLAGQGLHGGGLINGNVTIEIQDHGLTFNLLPQLLPGEFYGRPAGGFAGFMDVQVVTAAQLAASLPAFDNANPGMVNASGGGTNKFLRADHQWATIGSVNLSWDSLTHGIVMSGFPGIGVVIPQFDATYMGLVPQSGGGTTNFLRADGTWQAPPSGVGVTNLGYTPATRVLTSDTGTDVTLPIVSSTEPGLTPASGGGTTNFLRADGTWAVPSAGAAAFSGTRLSVDTSGTTNTGGATYTATLSFATEDVDVGGWHAPGNPTRITVPSGISYIEVMGHLNLQFVAVNVAASRAVGKILKNGVELVQSMIPIANFSGTVYARGDVLSGPIAVTPGDYFEFSVDLDGAGSNMFIDKATTFFTAKQIG